MKYSCPCCTYLTFDKEPFCSFEICPVCYWKDDGMQNNNSNLPFEQNRISLDEAKRNFLEFGAIKNKYKDYVRRPFENELTSNIFKNKSITLSHLADIIIWSGVKTIEELTKIILAIIDTKNEWSEYKSLFENLKSSANDKKLKDSLLPDEFVSHILDSLGMVVFYREDSNSLSSLSYESKNSTLRLSQEWSEYIRRNGFSCIENYSCEDETAIKTSDALFKYGFKVIDRVYERTNVSIKFRGQYT